MHEFLEALWYPVALNYDRASQMYSPSFSLLLSFFSSFLPIIVMF